MAVLALGIVASGSEGPSGASTGSHSLPRLTIVVVAGQSNALGYQSYVVDPKTRKDVFTDGTGTVADRRVLLTWDESGVPGGALPPVSLDTPQRLSGAPSPVFGPEVGLARYLFTHGHRNLLIVKVAFSGSSLAADWVPGAADYKAMVRAVGGATLWASEHGWRPVVSGFYWMQGETDAMTASTAETYGANLKAFIGNARRSIGMSSTAPFVIGEIDLTDYIKFELVHHLCTTAGCSGETAWNKEVMSAQKKAAGAHVFVASTSSLARYEGFLHLTNTSELALGKKFGELSAKDLG
jgi:hypothetical protein